MPLAGTYRLAKVQTRTSSVGRTSSVIASRSKLTEQHAHGLSLILVTLLVLLVTPCGQLRLAETTTTTPLIASPITWAA